MARNASASTRARGDVARRAFNVRFIGEAVSELRRVTWPTRDETTRLTIMVVAVAGTVGVFLGIVDIAFSRIMDVLLGN